MNRIKKFTWKDCIHIEFTKNNENFVLESQEEPLEELKEAFNGLRTTFLRSRQEFDIEHRNRYGIYGISFVQDKEGNEYLKIYGYYIFPHSGDKTDNANSMVMHEAFPGFWDEDRDATCFPFYVTPEDSATINKLKTSLWNFINGKRSQGKLDLFENEEPISYNEDEKILNGLADVMEDIEL